MPNEPMNLIYIFSDEHNKKMSGCYGHPQVKTPNIDELANNGVRFENAYCNSPVCVPSRASMASGRFVNEIKNWDNAMPYVGEHPSWAHRLTEQGHDTVSIGKLHYRDDQDSIGFSDVRLSMHVHEGEGDKYSLIRDNLKKRHINREKILEAGPGESSYIRYDRGIAEEAVDFLTNEAPNKEKPWILFVSFVSPHFPLIVPEKYYNMYPLEEVTFPIKYGKEERPKHPILEEYRKIWDLEDELDEFIVRKAVASYYGLCTFLDEQIGKVISAMKNNGLDKNTRIIYSSDHGDSVGNQGLWFKSSMYEDSVGVPFIMSGPDIPKGKVTKEPISLIDIFPTVVESVGGNMLKEDEDLPGASLFPIIKENKKMNRTIFSEYHAMGFSTGVYMIRKSDYKLVYYVGYEPQFFNIENDPDELHDLAGNDSYKEILSEYIYKLKEFIDPEKIHKEALEDQSKLIEKYGGREKILQDGFKIQYSPVPKQFL